MKKTDVYSVALSAMFAALGATLVIAGGFFEIIDLTVACIASLTVLAAREELGQKRAWLVYAVASCASLIFMPLRSATLYYVLFLGYFPILKPIIEKKAGKSKLLSGLMKLALFNVSLGILAFLTVKFIGIEEGFTDVMLAVTLISANVFLFAYDAFLKMATIIYRVKIKGKFLKRH